MNTYREELVLKFKEAGLKADDFYTHTQSKMNIIKHKGVEKLASHYGIWWKLDLINVGQQMDRKKSKALENQIRL